MAGTTAGYLLRRFRAMPTAIVTARTVLMEERRMPDAVLFFGSTAASRRLHSSPPPNIVHEFDDSTKLLTVTVRAYRHTPKTGVLLRSSLATAKPPQCFDATTTSAGSGSTPGTSQTQGMAQRIRDLQAAPLLLDARGSTSLPLTHRSLLNLSETISRFHDGHEVRDTTSPLRLRLYCSAAMAMRYNMDYFSIAAPPPPARPPPPPRYRRRRSSHRRRHRRRLRLLRLRRYLPAHLFFGAGCLPRPFAGSSEALDHHESSTWCSSVVAWRRTGSSGFHRHHSYLRHAASARGGAVAAVAGIAAAEVAAARLGLVSDA